MGREDRFDVCVIGGLGHAGLPLGVSFALSGLNVVLYDTDTPAAEAVAGGRAPFLEPGLEEGLQDVIGRRLSVSTEMPCIAASRFVVIVIGTPVDAHLNPQMTLFRRLLAEISAHLSDGQHVILRSTVFPGTTQQVWEGLRSQGRQTRVSYCPERIAEGKAMHELRSLPQIVATCDPDGLEEVVELFRRLTPEIVVLEPKEAEFAKLFTNAWRYVLFAISNQFFQIAARHDVDFYRIRAAMIDNYPRAAGFPPAGLTAGPCLLKDTMQLAAASGNTFFLGHAAMLVNEGLPGLIVDQLRQRFPLEQKVVGILGMAYKGNCDDVRESLSFKLKKILEFEAKEVLCSDPHARREGLVDAGELVRRADIVIIGAPHEAYRRLPIDRGSKHVVDIWNFLGEGGGFPR